MNLNTILLAAVRTFTLPKNMHAKSVHSMFIVPIKLTCIVENIIYTVLQLFSDDQLSLEPKA